MKKPWTLLLAIAPWLIIMALLAAGLLIKPKPVGNTVLPPVIEYRDRFYGVAVPAKDFIWLVGNDGKIIHSTNNGQSWQRQISNVDYHLQDISAWNKQQAVAVGNEGVVLRTEDAGKHWSKVDVPRSEIFNKQIRVKTYSDGKAVSVGAMGSVLLSEDYGKNWQRIAKEEDITWADVTIKGDEIWLVGEFGFIRVSSDNGATWKEINSPVKSSLSGIDFSNDQHGVAVGLDGVVLTTSDSGRNWNQVDKFTNKHLFSVTAKGEQWFAVGEKGLVVTANKASDTWQEIRLSERNLSWYTDIESYEDHVYLAGANVGVWHLGKWRKF